MTDYYLIIHKYLRIIVYDKKMIGILISFQFEVEHTYTHRSIKINEQKTIFFFFLIGKFLFYCYQL